MYYLFQLNLRSCCSEFRESLSDSCHLQYTAESWRIFEKSVLDSVPKKFKEDPAAVQAWKKLIDFIIEQVGMID